MEGKHAKGKRNELFEDAVPLSPIQGRESAHSRHPQFSLNVVLANQNETGVLYGLLLSAPYFDPSKGIQFVFEGWHIAKWDQPEEGVFLVSIKGHDLGDISNHIKASTEARLVLGENVSAFEVRKLDPKKG